SGNRFFLAIHLPPDLVGSIDLHVVLPHTRDMGHQDSIPLVTRTAQGWVTFPCRMPTVSRRSNPQDFADRLDSVGVSVTVDEPIGYFKRRSSSAWAKNALASFRISLARRSSLTSRSSALIRSRSSVLRPSAWPLSTSCCLNQPCRVWGTQPILGAMDSMAAHREGYSPRCSCTMRTARSRTSGEYFASFFMAPFSQRLEPPRNPGRFTWLSKRRS